MPFGRLEGSLLEAGIGTCLAVATLLQVTGWSGNRPKLDGFHPLYNTYHRVHSSVHLSLELS